VNAAQSILILAVRLYRWTISPAKLFLFGPLSGCRFHPSCSEYALEALQTHGALAGTWLALKRICRCHPWGGCGQDPVPPRKPEIRSPKSERDPNAEIRTGTAGIPLWWFGFRASDFFRISDFGFRTLDFSRRQPPTTPASLPNYSLTEPR
jgi:putative membrane protein insertion efficiency factor